VMGASLNAIAVILWSRARPVLPPSVGNPELQVEEAS